MPRMIFAALWFITALLAAVPGSAQRDAGRPAAGAAATAPDSLLLEGKADEYTPASRGRPDRTIGAGSREIVMAERRVALVIGNGAYHTVRPQLDNPEK